MTAKMMRQAANAVKIQTAYGDMEVWLNEALAEEFEKNTLVFFDINEDDGGLVLPSGITYYTSTRYNNISYYHSKWSSLTGFLATQLCIVYRDSKGKEQQLEEFSPDAVIISDMFFDLFLRSILPQTPTETVQFTLDRQTTVNDWCDKMHQMQVLVEEVNKLARTENAFLAKKNGVRTLSSSAIPRVRYKYL